MSGDSYARKRLVVALGIALAVTPLVSSANQARVDFSFGEVSVKSADGALRGAAKGAMLGSGDTIVTGNNSRVQLRFSDGSYVSLQPESEFRIDQYQFSGKQDGSERGFFSLLKGGLRTITGLVGRSNQKNYQVSTGVATIGIRGTEYSISADGQVRGSVGDGEIRVCNGGGCLVVANGESYKVATAQTQALMTEKKVDLPAPPVQPGIATINVGGPGASSGGGGEGGIGGGTIVPTIPIGEQLVVSASGVLSPAPTPISPTPIAPPGTQLTGTAQVLAYDGFGVASMGSITPAHSVPNAVPAGSIYDGAGSIMTSDVLGTKYALVGSTGLTWTHYLNATLSGSSRFAPVGVAGYYPTLHQITGDGTPLAGMPVRGIYTYSAAGFTSPTVGDGANVYVGSVQAASLAVDFATSTAKLSMDVSFASAIPGSGTRNYFGDGVIDGNTLRFDKLMSAAAACPSCWSGAASGFFAGANAEGVGLGYKIDWDSHRAVGVIGFNR